MLSVDSLNRFIKCGEKRSIKLRRNIIFSFLIRGGSVVINFSIVPLTIQYVDPIRYGIWVTLASIISWFTFFDFGMGNGLKNKLAAAVAHNQYQEARKLISTTYAVLALIALGIFITFTFVNPYINWNHFFNVPATVTEDIGQVLLLVMGTFCLQFVVQLLNTVLTSLQEQAKAELITFLGQAVLLITLIVLKYTVTPSLSVLVLALNVAPAAVLVMASLLLYNSELKLIAPSIRNINFSHAKSILNLGGVFLFVQLGSLVLHQTDNIIISRILGPEAVTRFNVTYKLFAIITLVFTIFAAPYWSAFTDAYAKRDDQWIKNSVKLLRQVWLFVTFIIIPGFLLVSKFLLKIIFPEIMGIQSGLLISMAVYVICSTCLSLNCYFLYGIGKLRILVILYLVVMVTNVPLGIFLGQLFGIEGVMMANILAFVLMNSILWIQTNKIVNHKAVGIWNS